MALNAYLNFTGETQGKIEGSATQAGREGSIEVFAFEHGARWLCRCHSHPARYRV